MTPPTVREPGEDLPDVGEEPPREDLDHIGAIRKAELAMCLTAALRGDNGALLSLAGTGRDGHPPDVQAILDRIRPILALNGTHILDVPPRLRGEGDASAAEALEDLLAEAQSLVNIPPEAPEDIRLTDLGNAERFMRDHGSEVRFCPAFGWLNWNGSAWERDQTGAIVRRASKSIRDLYAAAADLIREAPSLTSSNRKKAIETAEVMAAWALKSEDAKRIKAAVELATSIAGVSIPPDRLDADQWMLNCKNGVLDLREGKLLPHAKMYLMTKMAGAAYDPEARCPRWEKFVSEIMADRPDLVAFLKRVIGYCLTGDTRERKVFVLWGNGKNGKSVLLETVRELLGDYACKSGVETFLQRRNRSAINNDVARLHRARFVYTSESGEDRRLDEALIKDITGRERVCARFLHREFFEFTPDFKLFLGTNHKPTVEGTDEAIWDRLRLVPFEVRFEGDREDKDLAIKLRDELPGILRWAVEGCAEWQREGMREPEEVLVATAEYRQEMDDLAGFIAERCILAPQVSGGSTELHLAFCEWMEKNRKKAISQTAFGSRLRVRGYRREKAAGLTRYQGIGLLSEGRHDA